MALFVIVTSYQRREKPERCAYCPGIFAAIFIWNSRMDTATIHNRKALTLRCNPSQEVTRWGERIEESI